MIVARFDVWCHPRVHKARSTPGISGLEVEAPQDQNLWCLKFKMACKLLIQSAVQNETAEVGLDAVIGRPPSITVASFGMASTCPY